MASERQNMSEQEISIKAREHELYVQPGAETDGKPTKPFEVYLKETPAVPFSMLTKGILAIISIVVGLLFLGAIWRATTHHSHAPATRTKKVQPSAEAPPQRSTKADIHAAVLPEGPVSATNVLIGIVYSEPRDKDRARGTRRR